MKYLLKIISITLIFSAGASYSQGFKIKPGEIEFKDIFDRLVKVHIYNESSNDVSIDSLVFDQYRYDTRFDSDVNFPVILSKDDTLSFDFLLITYFDITADDIHDSLLVYSNSSSFPKKVKVEIEFFEDGATKGKVKGVVESNGNPVADCDVSFILDNSYILKTVKTDNEGKFEAELPVAEYTVLAAKKGYYNTFYGNTTSPFLAQRIRVDGGNGFATEQTVDISTSPSTNTGNTVTGTVNDNSSGSEIGTPGIIIIRKGTHTPPKRNASGSTFSVTDDTYTAIINPDGSFTVEDILNPGYYFIQSFANLYLPSYYNSSQQPAIFWQNADSVLVQGEQSNLNIYCDRDSSFGGGSVNGTITINGLPKSAVNPYNDIIIYAENVNTGNIFYYSLPDVTSSFKMDNLPAGEYMLRAQIIGLDDAVSKTFTVSPNNPYFDSISIKITTSDVGDALIVPKEFKLFQNYPNPFNPETKIKFTIPGNSSKSVSIKVYDVLGKLITTLVNEKMLPGEYEVNFNGNNLSSGVYFYVLKSGNVSLSQKMILMK